jgi:hypothetical protein
MVDDRGASIEINCFPVNARMRQSRNYCQIADQDTLVIRAGFTTTKVRRVRTMDCARDKNG